jgi:hypothetical protein
MLESAERIQYINDYIVNYENNIKILNKLGLFDNATLFELFAIECTSLWFGQHFFNLNSTRGNYPYVDLISENAEIFVQVSTNQNIPEKIKSTLEKIRDSSDVNIDKIKEVYFFVLDNSSISNVKDYSNDNQIGNISFLKDKHLITTKSIIEKAKVDLDFQKSLYELCVHERNTISVCVTRLKQAINDSKSLIENSIDDLIAGEYEINRSEILSEMNESAARFISVQGVAGSGKSALCKKFLKDKDLVLFARAERFIEASSLDSIWNLNLQDVFRYTANKRIYIYIDALEFIADAPKSKQDLLFQLYNNAVNYEHVYIITSCRSSDKNAFLKIESHFSIKNIGLTVLENNEINAVASKYPVIMGVKANPVYGQILNNLFYLNLIVSRIDDKTEIENINSFRSYIWTEIICLGRNNAYPQIKPTEIRQIIEYIVLERAKRFSSGVLVDELDSRIVSILESNGVIVRNSNKIRLKYDIFEDICFERLIDNKFDLCKGQYADFFTSIEVFGRCVYRRYQIWVENKLFTRDNRGKFLYNLLYTDNIPSKWKDQTIIGILKSDFCKDFFSEYEDTINGELLTRFLKLENLYAFSTKVIKLSHNNDYAILSPFGIGRECLISLLFTTEKYKSDEYKDETVKICMDYSKMGQFNSVIAAHTCEILEYYIQKELECDSEHYYSLKAELVNNLLSALYLMSDYAASWIKRFWERTGDAFINNEDNTLGRCSNDIIEYTLKNVTSSLAICLGEELCRLADIYWLENREIKRGARFLNHRIKTRSAEWGLSEQADSYSYRFKTISQNLFLYILVKYNFEVALRWIIKLTNHVANSVYEKTPNELSKIKLYIPNIIDKEYLFSYKFWLVGTQEGGIHYLVDDALYILTRNIIELLKSNQYDDERKKEFLRSVKQEILKNTNNVMMLTVISYAGFCCKNLLPGYSLELLSSIDLIIADTYRVVLFTPNSVRNLLEKQILETVGIPSFEKRYPVDKNLLLSLQQYMIQIQLISGGQVVEEAQSILDYLYSLYPNNKEYAEKNLQIQNMDLREASIRSIGNNLIEIQPVVAGEAKKITEQNDESPFIIEQKILESIIQECHEKIQAHCFDFSACLDQIERLKSLLQTASITTEIEAVLVGLIAYSFSFDDMDEGYRSNFCQTWIDGIKKIFNDECFTFDISLSKVLFAQVEHNLNDIVKAKLLHLMVDCVLYSGHHGIINKIATQLKEYLVTNKALAKSMFNAIVSISEDEMLRYLHNSEQICRNEPSYKYFPNMQKPPICIERAYETNNIPLYKNNCKKTVEDFLIKGIQKDYSSWTIDKCEIGTLCYAINCGLDFSDREFTLVFSELFPTIIRCCKIRDHYEFLDYSSKHEVIHFLAQYLTTQRNIEPALTIMFDSVEFTDITNDGVEVFVEIGSCFLAAYFDGYTNINIRQLLKRNILKIEERILTLPKGWVKQQLTEMLLLTFPKYAMKDWNELQTSYSYADKMFLVELWSRYGHEHFIELINIIYQLHITELLPEILIPIHESIRNLEVGNRKELKQQVNAVESTLNMIITKAFLAFSDKIKSDAELMTAYEGILEVLVSLRIEEAAVILDEFRIH